MQVTRDTHTQYLLKYPIPLRVIIPEWVNPGGLLDRSNRFEILSDRTLHIYHVKEVLLHSGTELGKSID